MGYRKQRDDNGRLTVFESVTGPGNVVKYVDQVVLYAPQSVRFKFFSWKTALFGSYDVFHIHFPEGLLRAKTLPKRIVKSLLCGLLILRLVVSRMPVVRTVHNVQPHERMNTVEHFLVRSLGNLSDVHVMLNDSTPRASGIPAIVIPHGHYRAQWEAAPKNDETTGRVLFFGRIRPYKGVVELVRALDAPCAKGLQLRIVGEPTTELEEEIREEIASSTGRGASFSTELRTVSDDEMVKEISSAELVLIPNQDLADSNSGVALLALSLDRPVLIRRVPLTEALAKETGPGWVNFFEGDLDAQRINDALAETRALRVAAQPRLADRDWDLIGPRYAEVFHSAVERVRRARKDNADHRRGPN